MADITPTVPDKVAGPKKALIGDEAVQAAAYKVEPEVHTDSTKPKYAPEATQQVEYPVHEVSVQLDQPVTDPTSPEAVQIPDAGRSPDTSLPIHALSQPSPNEALANVEAVEVTDEDRQEAYSSGRSVNEVVNDKSSDDKS